MWKVKPLCFKLGSHRTRFWVSKAATGNFCFRELRSRRHVDPWRRGPIAMLPYFKIVPMCVTDNMNGVFGGETGGSRRKCNDDESRIPVPNPGLFRRSASLRLRGERSSPRSIPEPIAESAQSCAKIWPGRPLSRLRSQVSVLRSPS